MFLLFAHNLIIGFEGTKPEDLCVQKMLRYAKLRKIKGVILFTRNIENAEQLKTLTKAFKKANPKLEITSDEEGRFAPFDGVSRLHSLVGSVKSAYRMAQTESVKGAYLIYRDYARKLKVLGITMVFGPCIDLYAPQSPVIAKYNRAYSENPEIVVEYARAFIKAFRDEGIKTVVKHYPGHGLAKIDTHKDITNVTETFQNKELIPFQKLSKDTPYIMMAHIIDDNVDPKTEASLSLKHYANARKMGYTKLITDDLHMGAVQIRHQPINKAIKKALKMGAIVIASNMPKASPTFTFTPDFDLPDKLD